MKNYSVSVMTSAPQVGAQITVSDVVKTYGLTTGATIPAADQVSLSIAAGSTVPLVGPSGVRESPRCCSASADSTARTVAASASTGADITGLRGRAAAQCRRSIGFVF